MIHIYPHLFFNSFTFFSDSIQTFPSLSYFATALVVLSFSSSCLEQSLEEGGKISPVAVVIKN